MSLKNTKHSRLRADLKTASCVGGGPKKVLYTLGTVARIGLKNSAKALTANNTCKACGLGMGGQKGGMTNELGEYPAVCNKSIQAQSTDIQPPVPKEIFQHNLHELQELSGHELEHLGRLGDPIYKSAKSDHYKIVSWDWALAQIAERFSQTLPERSFFYSSGRSSNEAGFVLQLLSRLYGTNNVNNCSYYCHQATSVGLGSSIGTGTATVELEDLSDCDLVFVIGANPSSNHPRFIHKLKACRDRGGHVIVINPAKEPGLVKFAVPKSAKSMLSGGSWIASEYLQSKIGTDIALFKGIAKALLELDASDDAFIEKHTQGFSGFVADIDATDWASIEHCCGIDRTHIVRVAKLYAQSKRAVFAWGMGITHHQFGVENVECIANLALLRGMIGKPFAGLLPLRGHSNVQGIGTIGVKPVLPADVFACIEKAFSVSLPKTEGMDTLACLDAAAAGNIDAALIMGGNLYGATPDTKWAAQALGNIGFKVFLTTTLNRGHVCGVDNSESIILPVTARDEEWQPTTQESMFNFVRLSDGGIERLDNVRPEVHILSDIAQRLLPECPVNFEAYKSYRKIRQAIAQTVPGMEQLADIDAARQEFHVRGRVLHVPKFNTRDGLATFKVLAIPTAVGNPKRYPFLLTTVRSEGQFNTIVYEQHDSYRCTEDRWSVLLNPEDMQAMGIVEQGRVTLESATGRMENVLVYAFDLPRGNAMAYFPEANVLVDRRSDPRSKTPAFKSVPIRIETTIETAIKTARSV